MYSIGEKIMYGGTGVCTVQEITSVKQSSLDRPRLYYVLKPLYQSGTIQIPVDNTKVPIRPVMTRDEAEQLVDGMPYGFEGMVNSALSGDVGTVSNALVKNWAESALELMNNDLRPQISQLQEQFAKTEHLFLSDDDKKLANKYLSQCEKRFNEVAVKVHNAKGLL